MTEAVNLIADMERMGLVRRMKVDRLHAARDARAPRVRCSADRSTRPARRVMHTQAEGVPFIVEEMARAYREGGMIQQIDGVWRLARNAERLVPSAVRTLISRRAAHLPDETKALLADAALLGRHFSLRICARSRLAWTTSRRRTPTALAGIARAGRRGRAAGRARRGRGRRLQLPARAGPRLRGRGADAGAAPRDPRGDRGAAPVAARPSPASLPLLAHHAKAAGDAAVCVRFSVEASRNALAANAPEEVLRVVEVALPSAATPQERLDLLEARDRAFDMLRRPSDRLEGLAELARARGGARRLAPRARRPAPPRRGAAHGRGVRPGGRARARGPGARAGAGRREAELAACMELGQDLLRRTAGEAFTPPAREVDLDGAEEAFRARRRARGGARRRRDARARRSGRSASSARPDPRVVRRADRGRRAHPDREARRGRRGRSRTSCPSCRSRRSCTRPPASSAGARALRAAR